MNKVLIIAHDFPPHGGGSVMRVLKFVKYLPQFGWRPIVLTVQPEYYRLLDESLLAEVPSEAVVVRTSSLQAKGRSQQQVLDTFHGSPQLAQSLLRKLRRWLYDLFLVHQDEDFLWLPSAWKTAHRLLAEQPVEVILTSSPPHCAQWLGLALKRAYRLPWVVDLRDGWLDNAMFRPRFPPRRWVEQKMEQAVMHSADRVLMATDPIRDGLVRSHPSLATKSLVLTNGFDPADFSGHAPASANHTFDIVYVGSAGGTRRPVEPLFRAIAQLLRQVPDLNQILRVRFVGGLGPTEMQQAEANGLSSLVCSIGPVAHREAIQAMLDADLLLVISSDAEGGQDVLTGKVFEYIAAERPILALAPHDAALSRLVRSAGIGYSASPFDVDQIGVTIRRLYERFRAGTLDHAPDPNFKNQFNRIEQTHTLAQVLAEVASRAQA
jgi:glycosyltransferase involved in cell wall biosynthesis